MWYCAHAIFYFEFKYEEMTMYRIIGYFALFEILGFLGIYYRVTLPRRDDDSLFAFTVGGSGGCVYYILEGESIFIQGNRLYLSCSICIIRCDVSTPGLHALSWLG